MAKVQPTTDHDGVAAAAPSDLAEAAEAPAPACTQEHESDGTDKAPSRRSLVLKGHTNDVNCLAALAGGRLASGSDDKSIIIWNLADGAQLAKLEGHTDTVFALAALADGRLASGRRTTRTASTTRSTPSMRSWRTDRSGRNRICGMN